MYMRNLGYTPNPPNLLRTRSRPLLPASEAPAPPGIAARAWQAHAVDTQICESVLISDALSSLHVVPRTAGAGDGGQRLAALRSLVAAGGVNPQVLMTTLGARNEEEALMMIDAELEHRGEGHLLSSPASAPVPAPARPRPVSARTTLRAHARASSARPQSAQESVPLNAPLLNTENQPAATTTTLTSTLRSTSRPPTAGRPMTAARPITAPRPGTSTRPPSAARPGTAPRAATARPASARPRPAPAPAPDAPLDTNRLLSRFRDPASFAADLHRPTPTTRPLTVQDFAGAANHDVGALYGVAARPQAPAAAELAAVLMKPELPSSVVDEGARRELGLHRGVQVRATAPVSSGDLETVLTPILRHASAEMAKW